MKYINTFESVTKKYVIIANSESDKGVFYVDCIYSDKFRDFDYKSPNIGDFYFISYSENDELRFYTYGDSLISIKLLNKHYYGRYFFSNLTLSEFEARIAADKYNL